MGAIATQITSLTIVDSTVYSDADPRKHQCSASLAFVRGLHRGPVNSPHKWPVTRKMFPFDDVIMLTLDQFCCKVIIYTSGWQPIYILIKYKFWSVIVCEITSISKQWRHMLLSYYITRYDCKTLRLFLTSVRPWNTTHGYCQTRRPVLNHPYAIHVNDKSMPVWITRKNSDSLI